MKSERAKQIIDSKNIFLFITRIHQFFTGKNINVFYI